MGLKLEKNLDHQIQAIDAINKVFQKITFYKSKNRFSNPILDIKSDVLMNNIKKLNHKMPSSLKGKTEIVDYLNLDIKMETGTGKTYVYTKTIYELNKNYGIHKFIILVPSLPIKLGTIDFIKDPETRKHFRDQYNKEIDLYVLEAKKSRKKGKDAFPSEIRRFVETSKLINNRISVLIVNMQLFKDRSMLTKKYASTVEDFSMPSEAIKETKPFIIIDEPHRFDKKNKTFEFINHKIKPQCILRFGATFPDIKIGKKIEKDYHNLIYNLGSCDAFNKNLVKGVKVTYLEAPNGKNKKIKVLELEKRKKVKLQLIEENQKRSFELEKGDSLKRIDASLENVLIEGIGKTLVLSNGQELNKGSEIYTDIYGTSYQQVMLKTALDAHFKIEKQNFKRKCKIKTLALFFIDDIDSYRENKKSGIPTYLKDMFEKILQEKLKKEIENINQEDADELEYKKYLEESLKDIDKTHGGYFSKDNHDSADNIAEEINKILINKEETISIYKTKEEFNTFRFIFSKWTLKEGWDNPNIFTIAKLRSSGSEISKIQEVGRGLRLPVNENMARICDEQFYLNYIVDFTEKDFAQKLVEEINGDIEENKIMTEEQLERIALKLGMDEKALFIDLLKKDYIDMNRNIILENRDKLFSDYPDFENGLYSNKIINENEKVIPKAKIRKDNYDKIKKLWEILNKKYFISYTEVKDEEILPMLVKILKQGIDGDNELISYENTLQTKEDKAYIQQEASKQYKLDKEQLLYHEFLDKVYRATNIPIKLLHLAFVEYNKFKKLENEFFNHHTLVNYINQINEWKKRYLLSRFKYVASRIQPRKTALTNSQGNLLEFVTEGSLGKYYLEQVPNEKYLYDACLYDSELEKKNITIDYEQVIAFGKIPSKSIRIPLIDGFSYSPDFMYVVKRKNEKRDTNLVIETKDYENENDIPADQLFKIDCAKKFFEQLQKDGYDVRFEVQTNDKQLSRLIEDTI